MDTKKEIITCIAESDLVLVDTCVFGRTDPSDSRRGIAEFLYETKRISELEFLTNEVFSLHQSWRGDLHNIVSKKNVYTIPGVVEEISRFANILQETYKWHTNRAKKNIKREKSSLQDRTNLQEQFPVVSYLNDLIRDVRRTISRLNVYQGPKEELPRNVPGASETDYGLVEAAVGYSLSNPEMKVEILSEDRHVRQIVRNYMLNEVARTMRETQTDSKELIILSQS
jgi:hypothetical protein